MALRMNDCWHCQSKDPESFRYCDECTMMGRYTARLCTPCKNEWDIFVNGPEHAEMSKRRKEVHIQYTIAKDCKDKATMLEAMAAAEALDDEWFKIAEKWAPKPTIKEKSETL